MHLFTFVVLAIVSNVAVAKIPSYIQVCKRNNPKLEECIINSIEQLRPKLAKGIPELDVPALEPLLINRLVVHDTNQIRAIATNLMIRGASKFAIKDLKADIKNNIYQVALTIPFIQFNASYDVNAKILNMNIKGKGPIFGNITNADGNGIAKGHVETRNGKTYLAFDSVVIKLKVKNYDVHLENLFNGDKTLGEAVNAAVKQNKKEIMEVIRPRAEEIISEILLQSANRITQHFEYEELFPAK